MQTNQFLLEKTLPLTTIALDCEIRRSALAGDISGPAQERQLLHRMPNAQLAKQSECAGETAHFPARVIRARRVIHDDRPDVDPHAESDHEIRCRQQVLPNDR